MQSNSRHDEKELYYPESAPGDPALLCSMYKLRQ